MTNNEINNKLNARFITASNSLVHYSAHVEVLNFNEKSINFVLTLTTHIDLKDNEPITKFPLQLPNKENPRYQYLSKFTLCITADMRGNFNVWRPGQIELYHNLNYYPNNKQTIINNTLKNVTSYLEDKKAGVRKSEYPIQVDCDLTNIHPIQTLQTIKIALLKHQIVDNYIDINNKLIAKYGI